MAELHGFSGSRVSLHTLSAYNLWMLLPVQVISIFPSAPYNAEGAFNEVIADVSLTNVCISVCSTLKGNEESLTLNELGKLLGLSVSTVSRALSRPDLVSPSTRKRVLDAALKHGYTPNAIAQSLQNGKTRVIGVLISDLQNPFYSSVVRAIERVAATRDYTCVICNSDEDPASEAKALTLLTSLQVAGLIVASSSSDDAPLKRLKQKGVPIVEIDRLSGVSDLDAVLVDNAFGGRLAAEHLLDFGHRRIAVVTGPSTLTTARERLEGFQSALNERGIELLPSLTEVANFRESGGYSATSRLLNQPERPTAFFVANNEMMAGALAALREKKLRVPADVSLISFDDVRWAQYVEPPLTVIAQPTEQIGTLAAGLLFERLGGKLKATRYMLRPELVRRASCATPSLV